MSTDHEEYWQSIEDVLDGHPAFERLTEFGDASFALPVGQPLTNYEAKYSIEGRKRLRASWRRRPDVDWRPPG